MKSKDPNYKEKYKSKKSEKENQKVNIINYRLLIQEKHTSTHVLEIIGSELFGSHNHVAIFVFIKIHGTIISNGVIKSIKYMVLFLQEINYFIYITFLKKNCN